MTVNEVKTEIQRLTLKLLDEGLALQINPVAIERDRQNTRITWTSSGQSVPLTDAAFATLDEYKGLLQNQQYTCILLDGSVLQLSYTFDRNTLVKHRLGYHPCPFQVTAEEVLTEGLLDWIEGAQIGVFEGVIRLMSPLRFDYDSLVATSEHPASHLHVSFEDCRIPVSRPLCPGDFVKFVFKHFYPQLWREYEFVRTWPCTHMTRCLADEHRFGLHLEIQQRVG